MMVAHWRVAVSRRSASSVRRIHHGQTAQAAARPSAKAASSIKKPSAFAGVPRFGKSEHHIMRHIGGAREALGKGAANERNRRAARSG